ncbi:Eco57I restriction-modification methylase domain-containing protein [Myroides odoratimimus]|uniref:Eco57I restriction-modification methylase domain-containing protein n=1 Tax=Myroides odoratimimus TaxID=76832 RepID=UPI002578E170|nr:TaqI-like C-terminal specificity domain-containing protein [Myroides odoratimimus]MDM1521334.1 restriction endonuclease subunit M [Myroides odoratimimus]
MNLQIFNQIEFIQAIKSFFKELNVPMNSVSDEPTAAKDILQDFYKDNTTFQLIDDVYFAGMIDDAAFAENQSLAPAKIKSDYDGILVFGITLKERPNGLLPTRSQLAEISRAFNRAFYFTPVVVIFKYDNHLAFSNTERLKYKQEWREGEKAGKVSLLRDINIEKTHSGHERILTELRIPTTGTKKVDSFSKLYTYWQDVFSVSLLNKKFYQELSNWYFWATKHVTFPGEPSIEDAHRKNVKLEDLLQEHRATNVIRMLTRLLFVWFIKEKKLIPEELFELEDLQKDILKDISPYNQVGSLFSERNAESVYYKAILQNLFFATLNCPIEGDSLDKRKRGFRGDGYGTHRGIDYLMRYKQYFKNPDTFLEKVNTVVPFLNGGLFECLDDKFNNIYIDGFSDQMANGEKLIVPDYLFFGLEEEEDLSDIVGVRDKKYKQAAVKGLINILKSYKFTITENTPIEEDVALDPELLGKVFENLLASYNPETKTTARKQTGSFYTPREIVDYMVDESLITYLKNAISDWGTLDDKTLDKELHILTSYDNKVPFVDYPDLQKEIIAVLSRCTILDPACGSGAFPMGILQKMVHILQKLDSDNEIWKEVQLEKARKESEAAFDIGDKQDREERLLEINNAFDQSINDPNYARKLFLIENCIYGVDIQPIATQISKLRFFISLVVEQKVNIEKENFGIRPLPNLETKFVAANTLMALDKPKEGDQLKLGSDNQKVDTLKKELAVTRHKLFSARTKETKLKYRLKDIELRTTIAKELKENFGWTNDAAEKLATWDPYNQNSSSTFFDPEWMFNIKEGFNIITGNPPWGSHLSKEDKQYFKDYYSNIDSSTPNSFAYFIGEAVNHSNGVISYVLPDSILIKDFSKTRKLLKDYVYDISWYLNTGIPEENRPFVYVEHDVCVLLINMNLSSESCHINKHQYDIDKKKSFKESYIIDKNDFIKSEHDYSFNLKIKNTESNLYSKLESFNVLSEILQCHEGIHTGNSRELLFHNTKINTYCKPLFYGGRAGDRIKNYVSETSGWFVDYRTEIIDKNKGFYASLRDERIFKLPKIYITRTGNPMKAFYDKNNYASNNFFSLQFKNYNDNNEKALRTILPLILSKFSNYYIRVFAAPRLGDTFIETKIFHILKIPYPKSIIENFVVKFICDLIITQIEFKEESSSFQNVMDGIIFNLYFPDHMKEQDIDILKFVEQDINEAMQDREFEKLNETDKEQIIEKLHTKWNHPDNEVNNRIKLFAIRSPEILKPILES